MSMSQGAALASAAAPICTPSANEPHVIKSANATAIPVKSDARATAKERVVSAEAWAWQESQ